MKRSSDALKRLALETLGWALVAAGLAAIFLPGPGLLMLFGGLAILSQQYAWAERRMRPVEVAAKRAASEGVQTTMRITLSLIGVLWLWGTGAIWIIRPPAPFWWPVAKSWWLLGGPATGISLVVSGFIALGLIIWSVRRFRGSPYVPDEDRPVDEASSEEAVAPSSRP